MDVKWDEAVADCTHDRYVLSAHQDRDMHIDPIGREEVADPVQCRFHVLSSISGRCVKRVWSWSPK
jgi:hypothetical protein